VHEINVLLNHIQCPLWFTGKASKVKNIEDEQHISIENEKPKNSFEITGGSWTTTTPSGLRVATVAGKEVQVQPILAYHVTDPFSGTVSASSIKTNIFCVNRRLL